MAPGPAAPVWACARSLRLRVLTRRSLLSVHVATARDSQAEAPSPAELVQISRRLRFVYFMARRRAVTEHQGGGESLGLRSEPRTDRQSNRASHHPLFYRGTPSFLKKR